MSIVRELEASGMSILRMSRLSEVPARKLYASSKLTEDEQIALERLRDAVRSGQLSVDSRRDAVTA